MRARSSIWPLLLGLAALSKAVSLNQIDTFQDGTTMSWAGGSSPMNIASGGPAGVTDRFLQITSTGSNLATFNQVRWSGNFAAAGINRIEADLRNTGANQLTIRLVFFSAAGDRWSSNAAMVLPAGSNWTHVPINLSEAAFTRTLGTGSWNDAITNVERMMFRHEPTISANGTPVVGQLGLDNIAGYAQVTPIGPSAFTILSGISAGGALAELQSSDDLYRIIRQNPSRARLDPAVAADFSAFAPPGVFSTIEFRLETGTNAIPAANLTQKIELFNFAASTFVLVDSRPGSGPDATVLVSLPGNPNDFIGSGRQVHGKFTCFDPGTVLTRSWAINFDLIEWRFIR